MWSEIKLSPIGYFKSSQIEPYQAARQPDELSAPGEIKLNPKNNFEQALSYLTGCSHVWIIYYFHHNQNWKPLVQTPRATEKIGVFATRAPYRPNPIGMSAVKLISVEGLNIQVGANDLLDGTPILDIKPYHPESDLILDSSIEWLAQIGEKYSIRFSPLATDQLDFINLPELKTFILRQLAFDPMNSNKKRVEKKSGYFQLSYRTWRIDFLISDQEISIISIHSGYSTIDLSAEDDQYLDKELHRHFVKNFG